MHLICIISLQKFQIEGAISVRFFVDTVYFFIIISNKTINPRVSVMMRTIYGPNKTNILIKNLNLDNH